MERARYNTELCSNPGPLLNNVKPSNFWGSHQNERDFFYKRLKKLESIVLTSL